MASIANCKRLPGRVTILNPDFSLNCRIWATNKLAMFRRPTVTWACRSMVFPRHGGGWQWLEFSYGGITADETVITGDSQKLWTHTHTYNMDIFTYICVYKSIYIYIISILYIKSHTYHIIYDKLGLFTHMFFFCRWLPGLVVTNGLRIGKSLLNSLVNRIR
jgi:hypothetical protein